MSTRALTGVAGACFLVGAGLMIGFEAALTRLAGVVLMVAFIVLGALAVASPEHLRADDDEGDSSGGGGDRDQGSSGVG